MRIEIATTADIDELTRVEISSKKESIPECIGEVDIHYATRQYRWQTYFAGQSPATSKPGRIVFKAVDEDRIIGFIAGHLTTRFDKDAEIQNFYVLKNYQRKSIGYTLLVQLIKWLAANKANSLCVGIAEYNPYQSFYLKYGGQYLNEHWIFWDDIKVI
jgi:GNAT superfamily N-acetyltransferase